jgi:hypothetical protein
MFQYLKPFFACNVRNVYRYSALSTGKVAYGWLKVTSFCMQPNLLDYSLRVLKYLHSVNETENLGEEGELTKGYETQK